MAERYLIDTSAAIKYLKETLPEAGLSFISEIELQVWNPPNPDDVPIYSAFVAGSVVIGISPEAIR